MPALPDERLRRAMVAVCRRMWRRGLIAGLEGNVSARLADGRVLVTPSGIAKRRCAPDDLVVVDLDGTRVAGGRRPTSELAMHLRIYERRPDVRAVVHAHPPVATGFALAGETLPPDALPEIIVGIGEVPLIHYETPGSPALADALAQRLGTHAAFLLANHGALTIGPSLAVAYDRMESLEHIARIVFTARALGRVNALSPAQLAALAAQTLPGGGESRSCSSERTMDENRSTP